MRWAQISNIGLVRALNEDSLCISPKTGLFAVQTDRAPGRGGCQHWLRVLERELGRNCRRTLPEKALVEVSGKKPVCL